MTPASIKSGYSFLKRKWEFNLDLKLEVVHEHFSTYEFSLWYVFANTIIDRPLKWELCNFYYCCVLL